MKFRFSDEQEMLRRAAGTFASRELTADYLRQLDARACAPHGELLPKMAAVGFTALSVPPEYGGVGGSAIDAVVLLEELGRTSLAAAAVLNSAIGFGCDVVNRYGSEAQKRELLTKVLQGSMYFACALTEPFACADAATLCNRVTADGDSCLINGAGDLMTGAAESRCMIVAALADSAPSSPGFSLFAIDPQAPGIKMRKLETIGMRGAGSLYEVTYENVRLPRGALLGTLDGRWESIQVMLEREGIFQAAYCIGSAQQVIADAVRYAGERKQFGQAIGKFQAIAHLLADLQAEVDAARWLMYHAAWCVDSGAPGGKHAAMASLACTEALLQTTAECMRVYGGYGLTMEFDIQRHFRDARSFVAENGARQVRRNQIGRAMGIER